MSRGSKNNGSRPASKQGRISQNFDKALGKTADNGESENEEAVVAAGSVGSVENNDLTNADEQLRGLAEAIGENGRASALKDNDMTVSGVDKRNQLFRDQDDESNLQNAAGQARNQYGSGERRTELYRQHSMGAKFSRKYTFVDLVDNINTDVKSEVADFDFHVSSKDQVVSYFESKMAQIRQEHQTQVKELKDEH